MGRVLGSAASALCGEKQAADSVCRGRGRTVKPVWPERLLVDLYNSKKPCLPGIVQKFFYYLLGGL